MNVFEFKKSSFNDIFNVAASFAETKSALYPSVSNWSTENSGAWIQSLVDIL